MLNWLSPENLKTKHLGIWLAFLMLPIARSHWQFQWLAISAKPILIIATVVSLLWLFKRAKSQTRVIAIWQGTSLVALASEWTLRQLNSGEPMELLLLELLWCVGIASRFGEGSIAVRTSDSIAVFLAAFVFFINPSIPVAIAGSVFAMSMVVQWLQTYWVQIQSEFVDVTSVERTGSRLFLPTILALALIATFGLSLRIPVVAKFTSRFSPFSGGEAWADQFAMSGIGDGEALVAAKEMAQTEGPVDSEIFIESKKRSLYDIVSDQYGEAKKPNKNQQMNSAVSLTTEKLQKNHKKLASAEKNSATFSLTRQSKGKREIPADLNSNALILVEARGPLALKLETYDRFDGQQWSKKEQAKQRFFGLTGTEDNDWFCLKRPVRSNVLRSIDQLAVSIVHLESPQIPTPPLLEAWSIPQVNRMDFYRVDSDQLTMNIGNSVPQFTRVSMLNRGFHLPDYIESEFLKGSEAKPYEVSDCVSQIREVGIGLTEPYAAGSWKRVDAIVNHLRANFKHIASQDSQPQKMPETSLRSFWESGRGEDFHFATAASVMLREAGFETRLVQGFYVRPAAYDPRTRKSAVVASDLHTWLEVKVESNVWVPIEPTPGYQPIPEAHSWGDLATDGFAAAVLWIVGHPLISCMILLLVCGVWICRFSIKQVLFWILWRTLVTVAPGESIKWTLHWSSQACPKIHRRESHEPIGSWINRLAMELGIQRDVQYAFLHTVNCDLYKTNGGASDGNRQQICFAWVQNLKQSIGKRAKIAKETKQSQYLESNQ